MASAQDRPWAGSGNSFGKGKEGKPSSRRTGPSKTFTFFHSVIAVSSSDRVKRRKIWGHAWGHFADFQNENLGLPTFIWLNLEDSPSATSPSSPIRASSRSLVNPRFLGQKWSQEVRGFFISSAKNGGEFDEGPCAAC